MDFQHFTEKLHVKTHELKAQLIEVEVKAEACAATQKNHYANLRGTTQQITNSIVNSAIASLKQSIEDIMSTKLAAFEWTLNQVVDDVIQDVYVSTDDGHKAMLKAHEVMLLVVEEQPQEK